MTASPPLDRIRALSFDTGGTLLDWHSGFRTALEAAGRRHGLERDWPAITNELRLRSLALTLGQGSDGPAERSIDDSHRLALDEVCVEHDLEAFDGEDRRLIAWDAPHALDAWPDAPAPIRRLRERYIVVTHTILSFRLIVDAARRNDITWDAVFSCQALGVYKPEPASYRAVAGFLSLEPAEILMVASHENDLAGARAAGMHTAFVHRPDEWGGAAPPDPTDATPDPACDLIIDTFDELVEALGA